MAAPQSVKRRGQYEVVPFLTAWDPSDLPGGSVDPLGFDRGYNALADKILPGLTNVASLPRYFGLLCAGSALGPVTVNPTRSEIHERLDCILRLERLWALAQVLAAEDGGPSAAGVRGVTYAVAQRDRIDQSRSRRTTASFVLLSRQIQYGAVGIYGNVAHGMRLIDRKSLQLSSDFGEALGQAFLAETQAPRSVRDAARDPAADVGVDLLRAWGLRANISGHPGPKEARLLGEAMRLDGVRARMVAALQVEQPRNGDTELDRLARMVGKFATSDRDLVDAVRAIRAYEECYAWSLLAFERILWRCGAGGAVPLSVLGADNVLDRCANAVPGALAAFDRAVDGATTAEFKRDLERLEDIRAFFSELSAVGPMAEEFAGRVLARHAAVQQGKFDRGRRKLPWVEVVGDNALLTLARAPQVRGEPLWPGDIAPHEYRTRTADALSKASAGGRDE